MFSKFFIIGPEDIARLQQWGSMLMGEYRQEAEETLKEEGLAYEAMFLLRASQTYVVAFRNKEHPLPTNMERELNKKHRAVISCLTPCASLPVSGKWELLYELKIFPIS